jgi:hypothetical protein
MLFWKLLWSTTFRATLSPSNFAAAVQAASCCGPGPFELLEPKLTLRASAALAAGAPRAEAPTPPTVRAAAPAAAPLRMERRETSFSVMIYFMFFLFSSEEVIEKRPHLHRGDP